MQLTALRAAADATIAAHEKAIALNPEYYAAWVNLGIAYRHMGDLDQAEECYVVVYCPSAVSSAALREHGFPEGQAHDAPA